MSPSGRRARYHTVLISLLRNSTAVSVVGNSNKLSIAHGESGSGKARGKTLALSTIFLRRGGFMTSAKPARLLSKTGNDALHWVAP